MPFSLKVGNVQPVCKHVSHVRKHKIAQPQAQLRLCATAWVAYGEPASGKEAESGCVWCARN